MMSEEEIKKQNAEADESAAEKETSEKQEEAPKEAEDKKVNEQSSGEKPEEKSDAKQEAKSEGKKFKKEKPSKVDKEKESLKEQVAALDDKVKRQLAEFENFRNRTEKEKSASYDNGSAAVLKKILPVLDNFERGLSTVPEDKKDDAFVQEFGCGTHRSSRPSPRPQSSQCGNAAGERGIRARNHLRRAAEGLQISRHRAQIQHGSCCTRIEIKQ